MVDREMGEITINNNEFECYICAGNDPIPVSYTHLTLPTILLV